MRAFGLSYAYTTVSDGDELIFGVGFGSGSYTSLPIRGPFVYTGYAGMDTHKAVLDYDFEKIGAKGLKANFQYSRGNQGAPKHSGTYAGGPKLSDRRLLYERKIRGY